MNKTYHILLPKTSFQMKGNIPQTEPELIRFWKAKSVYEKVQKKHQQKLELNLLNDPT